jgi:hypothetical protein
MECDRYGDWCLRITHNGYQWTAVNIESTNDANAIIELLQVWVNGQKESKPKGISVPAPATKIQKMLEDMEAFSKGCDRAGNGRDARQVRGWIKQIGKEITCDSSRSQVVVDRTCGCPDAICRYRSATESGLCLDPTDLCSSKGIKL